MYTRNGNFNRIWSNVSQKEIIRIIIHTKNLHIKHAFIQLAKVNKNFRQKTKTWDY